MKIAIACDHGALALKEAVKAAEENGAVYHVGNVNSSDVFYGDHALVPEGLDSLYGLKKMGVMALEMEAAALYMNAARYGKRALCICTISDHILTGEERQYSVSPADEEVLSAYHALKRPEQVYILGEMYRRAGLVPSQPAGDESKKAAEPEASIGSAG